MAFGPGKYDDLCTYVRGQIGLTEFGDPDGGGVALIIIGGNRGPGFSVQADFETTMLLPDLLEEMARQIRKDVAG